MSVPRTVAASCPIERAVRVIGGRWKTMIVFHLLSGPVGYGQLRRKLGSCSERVFVRQVRELESDGVVERIALGGNPPRVDYQLTPVGMELHAMFTAMKTWGELHQTLTEPIASQAAS